MIARFVQRETSARNVRGVRIDAFRSAFTNIELVVVLAIVTLLLSITIPLVSSVRESARKTQCLSRLRELGIATESFWTARNRYPGFRAYPEHYHGAKHNDSALVQLLPYLGHAALHNHLQPEKMDSMQEPPQSDLNSEFLKSNVETFICPSDDAPAGGTNYRTNFGTTTGIHATWTRGNGMPDRLELEGLWGGFRDARHPGAISDGLSHTVFFSERVVGDGAPDIYTPSRDVARTGGYSYQPADAVANCKLIDANMPHASFLGWTWFPQGYAHTAYNHVLTPNSSIPDGFDTWNSYSLGQGAMSARSYHPGGVNVVFGDGSARFISESIELNVWRSLGTNYGGEVYSDF